MQKRKLIIFSVVGMVSLLVAAGVVYLLLTRETDKSTELPQQTGEVVTEQSTALTDYETTPIDSILAMNIIDNEKYGLLFDAAQQKISVEKYDQASTYFDAIIALPSLDQEVKDDALYRAISLAKVMNDQAKVDSLMGILGQDKFDAIASGARYGTPEAIE